MLLSTSVRADVANKTRQRISKLSAELESTQEELDNIKTSEALKINKVNRLKQQISSIKIKIYNLNRQKLSTKKNLNKIDLQIENLSTALSENQDLLQNIAHALIPLLYNPSRTYSVAKDQQISYFIKCTKSIIGNLDTLETNYNLTVQDQKDKKRQLKEIISVAQKNQQRFSYNNNIKNQAYDELLVLQNDEEKIEKNINSIETSLSNLEQLIRKYDKSRDPSLNPGNFKKNLIWPLEGKIIQEFGTEKVNGNKTTIFNTGILIKSSNSYPVKAISTGVIAYAQWFENKGKLIIVDHQNGFYSLYGFNKEILVTKGEKIVRGQTIALSGKNPIIGKNCLYFEVRKSGQAMDPLKYLPPPSL